MIPPPSISFDFPTTPHSDGEDDNNNQVVMVVTGVITLGVSHDDHDSCSVASAEDCCHGNDDSIMAVRSL